MTTRLTPEQHKEIKKFRQEKQYMTAPEALVRLAYGAHTKALLAERGALLDIASQAIHREMSLLDAALNALRDAGVPEAPQGFNAPQAVILGIGLLRRQLEDAKARLVWSDELPTEPGLYWLQTRWRIAKKMPPQVVEVEFVDGELAVLFHGRENSCFADQYDDYQQQWSGPLVPPETEA